MFAMPRKTGARNFAPGLVSRMPSGTAMTTTIAVTTMVIRRWSPNAVSNDVALSVSFSFGLISPVNAQSSTAPTTMTTTAGCANSRMRSARLEPDSVENAVSTVVVTR
jgi:hypothetical protein